MSPVDVADSTIEAQQGDEGLTYRPLRLGLLLAILVGASFTVRLTAWIHWQPGAIESEGAEYSRLAENLRNRVGYIGLVTPGPQLNFNPLFPLLIAGTSFVTHGNCELAGRLVALVMGALLPLPLFGIGSLLFNRHVGFIAATLGLLHPLLIHLSFTVFSEGPYATLLLSSIYLVMRALHQSSSRIWVLVGAAFGLTWLLRAEASAAFVIAVLFALTATPGDWRTKCKRAAAGIAVFVAIALPEVIFIYKSTGKVKLEGKSTIFFYTGRRIVAAEKSPGLDYESSGARHEVPSSEPNVESGQRWEYKWAFYGIDSHLKGMGFPIRPNAEVVRETEIKLKDLLFLLVMGLRQGVPALFQQVSSDWLGAPLLPALALLGAFRRPWRGPQASSRLFVLLVTAAPIVATVFALWNEQRYYFVLVPLLSIWAANGLVEIALWMKTSSAAAGWSLLARPVLSQCLIPGLIGSALIISPVKGVGRIYVFRDSASSPADKKVGLWIGHQQHGSVKIMDLSIPLAFHAGAQFTYFPYCDGDMALRYLDSAQVDYVILRRDEKFTKYYQDWLTHGIPDQRAELLQLPPVTDADKLVIFRWHRGDVASSTSARLQRVPE